MESYIVKVLETNFVTHNVKHFVVEKPAGYTFVPGQATDVAINKPGLTEELRPFTFTAKKAWDHLEFMIKIYTGHNGVTEKLIDVNAGDELILHEVFGTIAYHGPGVFIAGGAGITPFIAILRQLKSEGNLDGNTLLFANHTESDIILRDELADLLGDNFINILKEPVTPGTPRAMIDMPLLKQYTGNSSNYYYICGPDPFTAAMIRNLQNLGVPKAQIIYEQ
jgi:ferredoxin-NADP reductase